METKYTKFDLQGNALPDSATSWSMVKDNVTGLMWEMKTVDGSIHDINSMYTWNQAQSVFIAKLNATKFGGFSDWRLPTIEELVSIVDDNRRIIPAVNPDYFPNTMSSYYWSASTNTDATSYTWCVYFGIVLNSEKWFRYYVRAVRGETLPIQPHLHQTILQQNPPGAYMDDDDDDDEEWESDWTLIEEENERKKWG